MEKPHLQSEINDLWVDTVFKIKYHGPELDKAVWNNTVEKHNKTVLFLNRLLRRIKELENNK